jgi:hypothetical protein
MSPARRKSVTSVAFSIAGRLAVAVDMAVVATAAVAVTAAGATAVVDTAAATAVVATAAATVVGAAGRKTRPTQGEAGWVNTGDYIRRGSGAIPPPRAS